VLQYQIAPLVDKQSKEWLVGFAVIGWNDRDLDIETFAWASPWQRYVGCLLLRPRGWLLLFLPHPLFRFLHACQILFMLSECALLYVFLSKFFKQLYRFPVLDVFVVPKPMPIVVPSILEAASPKCEIFSFGINGAIEIVWVTAFRLMPDT
jgi:hypothetical protein